VTNLVNVGKKVALFSLLAIIAIGAGLLYALWSGDHQPVLPAAQAESVVVTPPPIAEPPLVGRVDPSRNGDPQAGPSGVRNPVQFPDHRPWDQRLEEILLRGGEFNDKADAIVELIKVAPSDAQKELASHLVNMAQDDHYDGVAGLMTNSATPVEVSAVLMHDLLNRRNTLKLPLLLAIARQEDHPLSGETKELLGLFLGTEYGTNWDEWSSAVEGWLQQNQ
jgi:hypothetical protein